MPEPFRDAREGVVLERDRGIHAVERAVVEPDERAAGDLNRDVGIGQPAAEQIGPRQTAASAQRHGRRVGAPAVDVKASGNRSGVARVAEPADVELAGKALQIDAGDRSFAGVVKRRADVSIDP